MEEQQLIDFFRQNHLKVTTQRLEISKYILSQENHPSANQIYHDLRKDFPTISLGTIYNTLNLLKEIGLIQELGFGEGAVRYDPNTQVHINLICTKCHSIKDLFPENIDDWWNNLLLKLDTKPIGQRIDLYYICEKCNSH